MSELLNFILDHEDAFKSRARLSSLYSDFRYQAQTNPDGYNANISAWRAALNHASRAGLIPSSTESLKKNKHKTRTLDASANDILAIWTGEELLNALEVERLGRPVALAAVIQDAVSRREMIPLGEYLGGKGSIYGRRWVPTPWEVVRWSLRQLGLVGDVGVREGERLAEERLAVGRFVVVENVEAAANAILLAQAEMHKSTTSNIYSLTTFTATFSRIFGPKAPRLSDNDITILLTYMSRDKPHLSYDSATSTIKFSPPHTRSVPPMTENDISIASIKTLLHSLELAIPPLEERVAELDTKARDAVSRKQRSTGLAALRSKKLLETTLEKRRNNFLQLEETLQHIEQASDQVEIVQAMSMSTSVMRNLNEAVGGVEGVERVTDALREEMERGEDISNVLREPGPQVVVEEDVDEEFEVLMREEREKEEIIERAKKEKQNAIVRAAREKEEAEKAEATRVKMAELERFEREKAEEQRKKEAEERQVEEVASREHMINPPTTSANLIVDEIPSSDTIMPDTDTEQSLEASTREMGKMSLDETRPVLTELKSQEETPQERERELIPAS
ncbi:hypothetical protein EJ08DRAFT_695406 [Tothia fuscella]|uniref:Uncharacterized protein n=1 Tax=Tothia fuscella TaxID=1048955 RepID=A0A9P4NWY1_9PEZI|nr:hypothetical protein EJ08DRAFT_695406 [Tothia fuscella]